MFDTTDPDLKKARRQRPDIDLSKVDHLPPHSLPAEQGVLGCCLLDRDAINTCLATKLPEDAFYDLRHAALFSVLAAMFEAREPIDLLTAAQKLKDAGQLEAIGGLAYLSGLMDAVPSAANLGCYLDIVREKHVLRKMIQTCTRVIAQVHEHEGEVDALLDGAERGIMEASSLRHEQHGFATMKEMVRGAIGQIESLHQNKGALPGLATGFHDFDRMTGGLHGGQLVVIAARPSMGKTSLAMNIVEHVATVLAMPVGVMSLEMTSESLAMRMMVSHARVSQSAIRRGDLNEGDLRRLTSAGSKLSKVVVVVDDAGDMTILELKAKARRMFQQHNIRLLVVDYLQMVSSPYGKGGTREQEVANVSSGLKSLAKELRIPVVVLCQLNREFEKDKGRKPRMSDLRESGRIEADADVVAMLYRPENDDDGADNQDAVPVNLLIAKQRDGPCGDVHLTFFPKFTRFESAATEP